MPEVPPHIAAAARRDGFTEQAIRFLFGSLPTLMPGYDLDHEFGPAESMSIHSGPFAGWTVERCTGCNAGRVGPADEVRGPAQVIPFPVERRSDR